jgi:hypothetical protein
MTIIFNEKTREADYRAKLEALCFGQSPSNRWVKLTDTGYFMNGTDARPLWAKHRKNLIKQWVNEYPGTRPHAFWLFEAPAEMRLRLGGKGDTIPDHVPDEVEEYWRGLPTYWIAENRLMMWPELEEFAIDPDDPPKFESEACYLKRLGLLLPGEGERLHKEDFKPELILED